MDYTPYNQRDQWADVQPLSQDDGPNPLVPIAYSAECMFFTAKLGRISTVIIRAIYSSRLLQHADRDAMSYFRAISKVNEISERALELTEHIIDLNPAHYTIWYVLL